MKNYLSLMLLALLAQCNLYAQRWNLEKKNSIDIIAGPEISYLQLNPTSNSPSQFANIKKRTAQLLLNPSFRIGLDYNFALTEKLFLKSGGRLLTTGYQSDVFEVFNAEEQDVLRQSKQKDIEQSFDYNYKFLEIPLQARWVYSRNRCKSFVEAGLAGLLYLQSRIMAVHDSPEFSRAFVPLKESVTPFHLHAVLSIGGEFWITEDFPAFIQLSCRGQISKFINDGIDERTQGLGIKTGVRYLF